MKKKIIWSVIVVLVLSAVIYTVYQSSKPKEIDIRTAQADKGILEISVTATGYLQPVLKVDIGTQVSGIVEKLHADFNDEVQKGDLIAELDKSTLQERVMQTEAALSDTKSNLEFAQSNYDRVKKLFDVKAAPLTSMEEAVNRLAQAKNSVTNAQANHNQALVNLSYGDIYAPISGRILNRAVDEGQTVAASFNTPTLYTIANDLKKMQVEADVDEADIGQVKLGQKVVFNVDTYPGEEFEGEVSQIRAQAKVTANVVTYVVIISAPNPDEKLLPGMTANVTIVTNSPEGILIPSEAVYFRPDSAMLADKLIQTELTNKQEMIWVKTGEKITPKAVKTGASDGVKVVVLRGIEEGDTVVLSAKYKNAGNVRKGGIGS